MAAALVAASGCSSHTHQAEQHLAPPSDPPPGDPPPSDPPPVHLLPPSYPTAPDAYEGSTGDNTPATASHLDVGEMQQRSLFPDGDVDYVSVTLHAHTEYELSVNRLSTATDVVATLIDTDGITTLTTTSDDYISRDSRIVFSVHSTGRYFVRIESWWSWQHGQPRGMGAYTLSVHPFIDRDGDGFSSYYDCDDANSTIYPGAPDIPGDGIDQNCNGVDDLDPTVADAFEPDDTPSTAHPLFMPVGDPWEYIYQRDLFAANGRTLTTGDEDWFTFTVEPYGAVWLDMAWWYVGWHQEVVGFLLDVFDASDLTNPVYESPATDAFIANPEPVAKTYYVRYSLVHGAVYYVPVAYSVGVDRDGDGYYSQDWDWVRDRDDGDPLIQ